MIAIEEPKLLDLAWTVGWEIELAPTSPMLHRLLAGRLSAEQIDVLLDLVAHQLTEKNVRSEGAQAVLYGRKSE